MIFKKHFLCKIDDIQHPDDDFITVKKIVNNIHDTLLTYPNHCVVLSILWEAYSTENWQKNFIKLVNLIKEQHPAIKILLIINSWYRGQVDFINKSLVSEVVFVDFFLLMTYYRLILNNESLIATNWNYGNTKFLFLTGKPYKIHRIRLLYKFKQHKLLSHATWSLFINHELHRRSREFLKELTDKEYNLFLLTHAKNPDNISMIMNTNGCHYGGIPYKSDLYQNSLFQVISETYFKNSVPWITEKTWLAIINRRPFLMASSKGTLEKLKKMGFKTFENYTKIQYDDIENSEQRLDAIVINTDHWINNIHNYIDNVEKDVEHNFQRLLELAQINSKKLLKLIDKHALECKIEDIIRLIDDIAHNAEQEKWHNWYNRIRDSSWPDCFTEDDFVNLPQWIQQECVEVFNYKPKET